jgi:hypothetical protein
MDLGDFEAHLFSEQGIQVAEGFIEKKNIWFEDQGPRQGHPLLLSATQLSGESAFETAQLDEGQRALYFPLDDVLREPLDLQAESQVIKYRHMGPESIILKDESDPSFFRGDFRNLAVSKIDLAVIGSDKT